MDGEINILNFGEYNSLQISKIHNFWYPPKLILNSANGGSLQISNKKLTLTVGDESQSLAAEVDHQSFYAIIIASNERGTQFTVVDGANFETLDFAGSLSLTEFSIGSEEGADFEAVIADMRYQSVKNNYDVMNGKVRQTNAETPTSNTKVDDNSWFICSGWKCSGIQYNTMYSFN